MSLSEKDVLKIAKLSRIRLKEGQAKYFQTELSSILEWVTMLNEVNTDQVPQMTSVSNQALPLREDIVHDGNICDAVLKNAPNAGYGCFIVPKVVE
jgi:aspartyl-tRNA(Asn)/glutamyl-tRNA(Gln) amidotransferase subunit C